MFFCEKALLISESRKTITNIEFAMILHDGLIVFLHYIAKWPGKLKYWIRVRDGNA